MKKFLLIACSFLLVSCGSVPPDVGQSECYDQPDVSSVEIQASSSAMSVSGVGGNTTGVTSSSITSTGVGGMQQVPEYETPNLDEIMTRLHSCHKLTYSQIGNFLKNRGVSVPINVTSDVKTSTTTIFGVTQTLSQLFGGSGMSCEMADTVANGSGSANDPLCPANEVCFCNQDDKQNDVNRMCLDVGNNSPDAKDGYCVSKPSTAGYLYFTGKNSLGVPKLDSRLGEKDEHTTASAMKLMDIFIQSAPQIITNIGNPLKAPACTINGKNKPMFDSADGSCIEESVSCLIGTPATEDHMLLCNLLISKAKQGDLIDLNKKRIIAISTLLSAAHSCQ